MIENVGLASFEKNLQTFEDSHKRTLGMKDDFHFLYKGKVTETIENGIFPAFQVFSEEGHVLIFGDFHAFDMTGLARWQVKAGRIR